jgi:aldehyde dehydrogenase (NAD+)
MAIDQISGVSLAAKTQLQHHSVEITSMKEYSNFYINGEWVKPHGHEVNEVINPATEEVCARVASAIEADINDAFAAAHAAFPIWSTTPAAQRRKILMAVADEMKARKSDLIDAHVETLGVPKHLAAEMQVDGPIEAVRYFAELALTTEKTKEVDGMLIVQEAAGVCALINPWNYPLLQMIGKVAPAIAAGCTMVEKPSEETPTADFIMAEIFHKVGLPAGVFNLVSGRGSIIGPMMSSHPLADLVSFTGSTRAGISVAESAAPTVKRVCQELGGKSALIITADADLEAAVPYGIENVFLNTGQTCDALTRMFVHRSVYARAVEIAEETADKHVTGDPLNNTTTVGPLVSFAQKKTVDRGIKMGIDEGATLIAGGSGVPDNIEKGAYVKPTIFGDVTADMQVGKEEIFGPVLCMIPYDTIDEAVEIANSSEYGLGSGVWAGDRETAIAIARRLRAGQCFIQGGYFRVDAPFGGYKQSGNGREWGEAGLAEYLETKAIIG